MTKWSVVTFKSTHFAVKAEKVTWAAGIDTSMIPAPRHVSHDCGVVLRFPSEDRARVEEAMERDKVEYETIVDLD